MKSTYKLMQKTVHHLALTYNPASIGSVGSARKVMQNVKIGYARVSSKSQNLEAQVHMLKHFGVEPNRIYAEKYTGKTTDRPQFNAMLKALQPHNEVVLVRLDRFARNLREALNCLHAIKKRGCTVMVLSPYPVKLDEQNRYQIYSLLMFAEMERKAILQRTEIGKEYAKKHNANYHEGRPNRFQGKHKVHYLAIFRYTRNHSIRETAKAFECSPRTVCYVKKEAKLAGIK